MRAIYVGRPLASTNGHPYHYGATGVLSEQMSYSDWVKFEADGAPTPLICRRYEVYVPAEDKTEHCPKP